MDAGLRGIIGGAFAGATLESAVLHERDSFTRTPKSRINTFAERCGITMERLSSGVGAVSSVVLEVDSVCRHCAARVKHCHRR